MGFINISVTVDSECCAWTTEYWWLIVLITCVCCRVHERDPGHSHSGILAWFTPRHSVPGESDRWLECDYKLMATYNAACNQYGYMTVMSSDRI